MRIHYLLLPFLFCTASYTISMEEKEKTNDTNTITIINHYKKPTVITYVRQKKFKIINTQVTKGNRSKIKVATNGSDLSSLTINIGKPWEDNHLAQKFSDLKNNQFIIINKLGQASKRDSDPNTVIP